MFGQWVWWVYNMWRAAPSCMKEDITNCILPEVRSFLYFSPSRIQELFNSGHKVISSSAVCEAEPLGDTCFQGVADYLGELHIMPWRVDAE